MIMRRLGYTSIYSQKEKICLVGMGLNGSQTLNSDNENYLDYV